MKIYATTALLAVIAAVIACGPGAGQQSAASEAEKAAFRSMIEQWDAAIGTGDYNALAALYTDDAVRMEPGEPAWAGNAAIRSGFERNLEGLKIEASNGFDGMFVFDDLAVVRGTGNWTGRTRDGDESKNSGKYMSLNARQPDGSWRIVWDIYNSDNPHVLHEMEGVWELVSGEVTNAEGETSAYGGAPTKSVKIVSQSHWTVVHQNVESESFNGLSGTYTVAGNKYTEHIDIAGVTDSIGLDAIYDYQISGDSWTIKTAPESELKMNLKETWRRIE